MAVAAVAAATGGGGCGGGCGAGRGGASRPCVSSRRRLRHERWRWSSALPTTKGSAAKRTCGGLCGCSSCAGAPSLVAPWPSSDGREDGGWGGGGALGADVARNARVPLRGATVARTCGCGCVIGARVNGCGFSARGERARPWRAMPVWHLRGATVARSCDSGCVFGARVDGPGCVIGARNGRPGASPHSWAPRMGRASGVHSAALGMHCARERAVHVAGAGQ